jgi:signal transduction histidine kinase
MHRWQLKPLPACLLGLTLAAEIVAVALSLGLEPSYDTWLYAMYSVVLGAAGSLVASYDRRNPIGWLFCMGALTSAIMADAAQGWALRATAEGWGGADAANLLAAAGRQPSGLVWILAFLLIPDGSLPSRRWRGVVWVASFATVLSMVGSSLSSGVNDFARGRNPYTIDAVHPTVLFGIGTALTVGMLLASVVSLTRRFRRSSGIERQQVKVVVGAAITVAVLVPVGFGLWVVSPIGGVLIAVALTLLPVATCVAILRYRLYDVELVINRTLVYGALTVLLASAYVATTLLIGMALGRGSAWATAAATLVVAVAFRPFRRRVQDTFDRRFNRAKYDSLHRMTTFLEALRTGRAAPEGVEEVLREVASDDRLQLLLYLPERNVYVDAHGTSAVPEPFADGRDRIPIERAGQPIGIVLYDKARQSRLGLLRQVIEAGGLAIEITRLRVELRRQLSEVEASRARILAATNEERRRIERDLHDGAQQRLVSVGLALRHAQHELTTSSSQQASMTIEEAVDEVSAAIEQLRGLAQGLPPSQLDHGLESAFRELARRTPLPVSLSVSSERFAAGVEAAVYFIGCEGVTNAVKHAHATRIELSAGRTNGKLVVSVADDGVGGATPTRGTGLTGLADRVTALGGTLRVQSNNPSGTTLIAELPCES